PVLGLADMTPQTPKRLAAAIARDDIDGVLTLNSTTATEALQAVKGTPRAGAVHVAEFALWPDVLRALHDGRLLFAVDQQAYLQGYLPVALLTQRARYGLFPDEGGVIATGPHSVTRDNAQHALHHTRRF